MAPSVSSPSCCCTTAPASAGAAAQARRTAKTPPSALISLGIAFFPKCPLCWAAYMSVLGSIGIVKLPYLPWMLPVLLALLAVHLLLLLRQLAHKRYWPFVCSVLGAACVLLGRSGFPQQAWLLPLGIGCLVTGSLLNNFLPPLSSTQPNPAS